MLWQPENETSWLLSDFPVNFAQPHIIAFSPLFTNRGSPVLNIEISKINVKRLLSSCWIQQIQQTWCLKYQQLPLQPEDLSSSETQWKLVGTMRFPFCGSCLRWFEDEDKNYVPVVKSSTQICLTFCSGWHTMKQGGSLDSLCRRRWKGQEGRRLFSLCSPPPPTPLFCASHTG